ncbi:hypothetical protein [Halopelagius fulvigenes]|uniref:Rubrerythrin-like domain-containing protein n=1 Tax=Halopelagius fulvigenes TaxID=1198324 RepID=A0ABD5TTD1_9EURY
MTDSFDRSLWYECARCDFQSEPGDPTTVCPRCGATMRALD